MRDFWVGIAIGLPVGWCLAEAKRWLSGRGK